MRRLSLNCETWQTRDDFYDALFSALGAPTWHGRNFNALRDSIGTGSINEIEPPYCFVIYGTAAGEEVGQMVVDFCDLIRELKQSGCPVDVSRE
jgi:hypothetical protein